MKHMIMTIALAALIAVVTGCTSSTRIEWGGKMAVRQPDGTVLVDANGNPHYESEKNVYKDSNWLTKREERDVKVKVNADGSYEAGIGSRVNDVSTNGIGMVVGGLDATTKLVDMRGGLRDDRRRRCAGRHGRRTRFQARLLLRRQGRQRRQGDRLDRCSIRHADRLRRHDICTVQGRRLLYGCDALTVLHS